MSPSGFIVDQEAVLRLSAFLGLLILFAEAEAAWPRRARIYSRWRRWIGNGALSLLNTLALRLVPAILAVKGALWAEAAGIGLFNMLALPGWLAFAAGLLLLDLVIYAQHVAMHRIPLLWRLHKVHHTDRDVDVTTAIRFHPVEILLSMAIKFAIVVALGVPAAAVVVFEVVLNAMAMFNHANLRLPARLEGALRRLVVTPDMHRVHHSVIRRETDSNFGFNLSFWDRLFGTYRAQPQAGHEAMAIGLAEYADERPLSALWLLRLPFAPARASGDDGAAIDAGAPRGRDSGR